jgi:Transcriptional regulator
MEDTRNRIVEHAMNLFAQKGCKTLTMDEVATTLGVSKRTIYENFSNKNELIEACLDQFFTKHEQNIKMILKSSDNIIDAMFKQMHTESKMMRKVKFNFFDEIRKYYPEVYTNIIKGYRDKHLFNSQELLLKGQKEGVIRKDLNVEMLSTIMHELTTTMLNGDMFANYDFDQKEMMGVLMHAIMRGTCSDKGIVIFDKYVEEIKNKQ